jgi:hypothetical protein
MQPPDSIFKKPRCSGIPTIIQIPKFKGEKMRNAEFGMRDRGNSINEEWIVVRVRVGASPKSPCCGGKEE